MKFLGTQQSQKGDVNHDEIQKSKNYLVKDIILTTLRKNLSHEDKSIRAEFTTLFSTFFQQFPNILPDIQILLKRSTGM